MIRERLLALREKRAGLLMRAESERVALERVLSRADRIAAWAALGGRWLSFFQRRPWIVVAVIAGLVAMRGRSLPGLVGRAWNLYRLWRRAEPWIRRLVAFRALGLGL
jgi:hypothetical protein